MADEDQGERRGELPHLDHRSVLQTRSMVKLPYKITVVSTILWINTISGQKVWLITKVPMKQNIIQLWLTEVLDNPG